MKGTRGKFYFFKSQSLKKIGKKVLTLEQGNEAQSIFDIHQGP